MPTDTESTETGRKGIRFIAETIEEMHFIWCDGFHTLWGIFKYNFLSS